MKFRTLGIVVGLALEITVGAARGQRVEAFRVVPDEHPETRRAFAQFLPDKYIRLAMTLGAPDARVTDQFAVPVYFELPPRSYHPIGWVYVPKVAQQREDRGRALADAAAVAKARRADAIWLVEPQRDWYIQAVAFRWVR